MTHHRPSARRVPTAVLTSLGVVLSLALGAAPAAADPIRDAEKKIEKLASELGVVVEKYNQSRDKLDTIKRKAARIAKRLEPMQRKADKIYREVGKISKSIYKGSGVGATNAILSGGSPQTLVDQLSTLDRLAAGQKKGLRSLELIKSRIERQKSEIDSLLYDQRDIERSLLKQKKDIQKQIDKLQELRKRAYGERAADNGQRVGYIPPYVPGPAGKAVRYAMAQIGDPYVFAADGPESFDCSGLTLASWREAGVSLPHSAHEQYGQIQHVSRDELMPGDLVFYYSDLHHVGIYVGDGWLIHAPAPGENVEQVRYDAYPIYGYGRPG